MKKSELRKHYLTKRKTFSKLQLEKWNSAIIEQLKTIIPFSEINIIHLFLPIENQAEINLWPFIHWLWQTHPTINIVVPVCNFNTRTMTSHILTTNTPLGFDNYLIPEPINAMEISSATIDLVITPLVVCDNVGYRVGYGKGFYDAFFKTCRPSVQKIGVGLFDIVSPIEDINEWDIPLDLYITPKSSTRFA